MMLTLLFALSLTPSVHAAPDPIANLDVLLSQQKSEDAGCNKFRRKWHSVVKGGLSGESPSHISREQAVDALKLLEKFRFHGSAQAKAWSYLAENQATLAQVPDQKALLERVTDLQSQPCELFSRHVHRVLLLKDIAALKLGKKETKGIEREARDFLRHAGTGTMVGLRMKLDFLVAYVDSLYQGANHDEVRAKAEALRKEFADGRDANQAAQKALSAAGKGETIEYWQPELALWSKVNGSLDSLLAKLED